MILIISTFYTVCKKQSKRSQTQMSLWSRSCMLDRPSATRHFCSKYFSRWPIQMLSTSPFLSTMAAMKRKKAMIKKRSLPRCLHRWLACRWRQVAVQWQTKKLKICALHRKCSNERLLVRVRVRAADRIAVDRSNNARFWSSNVLWSTLSARGSAQSLRRIHS